MAPTFSIVLISLVIVFWANTILRLKNVSSVEKTFKMVDLFFNISGVIFIIKLMNRLQLSKYNFITQQKKK